MMSHNNHSKNDSNSNDFEANEVIDLAGTGNEIGNTRVGGKCRKCACGRLEVDDATGFQYVRKSYNFPHNYVGMF